MLLQTAIGFVAKCVGATVSDAVGRRPFFAVKNACVALALLPILASPTVGGVCAGAVLLGLSGFEVRPFR